MKFRSALIALLIAAIAFTSCTKAIVPKYGMVTDAGTIDDKSFNQGTWEGILRAANELKIGEKYIKYIKPTGTTEADYVKEIGNLYDAGCRFVVTPGFKFETAVLAAQEKYKDLKIVLIDGTPNNGAFDATRVELVGPNTVSIFFAEHEAGFIAGVAAALQVKDGEIGFIGGMEIPPVQKFNWGFQQGVAYANANLGTTIMMKAENVIYQGTFSEVAAGQQIAASMFDKGVKAIFCAAGGVGVGAITEAKARTVAGKPAWIIGVDVDQFNDGVYADGKSVILTSAMKGIDVAAFDMIKADLDKKFPGGQTLVLNTKNNGVGIPATNPNLAPEVSAKVKEVVELIKADKVVVASVQGSLIK